MVAKEAMQSAGQDEVDGVRLRCAHALHITYMAIGGRLSKSKLRLVVVIDNGKKYNE